MIKLVFLSFAIKVLTDIMLYAIKCVYTNTNVVTIIIILGFYFLKFALDFPKYFAIMMKAVTSYYIQYANLTELLLPC